MAGAKLPILIGTLLRPLHRATRILAFGALANAATSLDRARQVHDRARQALALPDTHYPKEQLIGRGDRHLGRPAQARAPSQSLAGCPPAPEEPGRSETARARIAKASQADEQGGGDSPFQRHAENSQSWVARLAADEEQLRRHNLPLWCTEEEIAAALGLTLGELWYFATHRDRDRKPHYITFAIPKRSGANASSWCPSASSRASSVSSWRC